MTRSTRRSHRVTRKDEFLILLADINNTTCITQVTGKILERLADPFEIDGQELSTSISMGIAIYPDDGNEFDTLLKKADTEDSGLIIQIGDWVLREACRQAAEWYRAGLSSLLIAVNLSAVQFKCGDLVQSVSQALDESGLDPALLELELTESILIQDTDNVLVTIRRLKALGIKLSIDDFDTGYSSLAYLRRFNLDKLKIDQSFVRDIDSNQDDEAIVRAIIQMARSLKLQTIAEGVENTRILSHLRALDCDQAQGYHFSRPLPAAEFVAYFTEKQTRAVH